MPTGAFIVFVVSFLIFSYLLVVDWRTSKTEKDKRPMEDSIWIGVFFTLLLSCLIISGICIAKSDKFTKFRKRKLLKGE
jgi:protein-S-isoprenylcysteine O-methyltransferase Ste14